MKDQGQVAIAAHAACDPITLEIVRGALRATQSEMEALIVPTDRRHANGRNRRVSLLAVRRGEGRLAEPDRSRSPFAPTQVDGLKIGSDTGTCFKVSM